MSALFQYEKIKYYGINTVGKDYVIGDIHGRYDLVYSALEQVNFNEECDRLFCVGDLIDRGALSYHVLSFLQKPYVYAVRGNHEDILLQLYENEIPSEEKIAYYGEQIGLNWWLKVDNENRVKILEQLQKLPLVIEIETLRGTVGLIHADIDENLSWSEFKTEILNENEKVIEEALWGRTRLTNNLSYQVEGVGRIYVGHTVQYKVKKLANVVGIDTGAVFNQHLTIADIAFKTQLIEMPLSLVGNVHVLNEIVAPTEKFSNYKKYNTIKK